MKLHDYFAAFLTDTVNLKANRLEQLDGRVASIVSCLKDDAVIGPMLIDHVAQGSWAHRTIINPPGNAEYDADFLLQLTEDDEWSRDPGRYLREVRAAFKRSSTYRAMVVKKNRCVRIEYANDCHVDVVPYLVQGDGREVIVNYAENTFEETNPQGFTDWMKEKDELANGHLRKVIRLVKYVRDYKSTFCCPSVILTTLLGERIQAYDRDNLYPDVPTAFTTILSDLAGWLDLYPEMPVLGDPSCPGTTFNHRWTQERYANFRTTMSRYAEWAKEALNEPDKAASLTAWQRIFGDKFQAPARTALSERVAIVVVAKSDERAPEEEFIEERGLDLTGKRYPTYINATVQSLPGFRSGPLRKIGRVGKNRRLAFQLVTEVPKPYAVWWKVRNFGTEASSARGLRGQLHEGNGSGHHTESTLYRGDHYIEVFVVKDNRVVGSDRHMVRIG